MTIKNRNISFASTVKNNKTYKTARIMLPKKWLEDLGIDENNPKVIIEKKDNMIIIKKD